MTYWEKLLREQEQLLWVIITLRAIINMLHIGLLLFRVLYKLEGDGLADARLRLFAYISQGEGGLQTLLNLRKVSTITKKWVDTLSEESGEEIFQKGQINLNLSIAGQLSEFIQVPPPPHITSLWLEFFQDETFPSEEEQNWQQFVTFWASRRKLSSLALGSFPTPYTNRVLEFLTSSSVRKIRFFWGSFRQYHFGEVYLQLEELWIDFRLDGIGTEDLAHFILGRLKENKKLRVLKVIACEEWAIEDIAKLIESKRDIIDFHLTLKLPTFTDPFEENESTRRFIRSVAASKSKISIECLPDPEASVRMFREVVGSNLAKQKLFPCIVSVCCYSDRPMAMNLSKFPNLRQVWTSNPVNLPNTVEEVQIEIDDALPSMEGLSSNLTHLTLWIFLPQIPADVMTISLITINETCPCLKKLKIFRTFRWGEDGDLEHQDELANIELPNPIFQNLDSFSLTVYCVEDELERASEGIRELVRTLLSRLTSLRKLAIISRQDMILLNRTILQSLLEGPMRETLCEVEMLEQNVIEEDRDLMFSLISLAEENRNKRRETHGIRCGKVL